jgi:RimJ/RimL family protein N-acetyltransferase
VIHTLHDGTRILLRPIEPGDKARLSIALGRLSRETIRRRFFAAKPSFSSGELRYLTEVDGHNHIALVALPADDPDSIIAVARCVRLPDTPDTAEFAIVVGDRYQGRGLGSLLARELSGAARAAGIRRFAATMLGDNDAIRRLMGTISTHLELDRIDHGVREVVVALAA